jgi:hypothetical protein
MANVKISDLPAATSVDPSDTFVMVQSGVTKQASQANILTTTGNVTAAKFFPTGTSATGTGMYSAAANTLAWSNNGAETMRLDASGNLGLGVTPSAWGAGFTALQMKSGGASLWTDGLQRFFLSSNVFYNGTNRIYQTTGAAGEYIQNAGAHQWFTAPSGTAGNAISFTQAMTLDASGNLGLGVTPSAWGSNFKAFESAGNSSVAIAASNINGINIISNGYADNTNWYYKTTGAVSRYSINTNVHQWFTAPSGTAGDPISFTQAMTLDASGNLGIGTSSPLSRIHAEGANVSIRLVTTGAIGSGSYCFLQFDGSEGDSGYFGFGGTSNVMDVWNRRYGGMTFGTNNTERARITSGGDLLVGTTSNVNNYKTHIQGTGSSAVLGLFAANATTPYGINVYYSAAAPNNSNPNTSFLYCNDTVGVKIQLASNGGISNYQANDSNLSDRREKTNFAPAKDYLDTICAIPVQTFNYIDQSEDDPGLTLGVVAQDVQAVAPELVMESNWGTEDNPKMRLSIYQTDLQYALMKCIQEQQALITDLRARVAALEA